MIYMLNQETPHDGKQEVIPKKYLQRGEVCSIDEWLEYCERNIESGSGRSSVEEYDVKSKAAAAAEGYTHVLHLPRENDAELKRRDLFWFARSGYFKLIHTLAQRNGIKCKHTDDQYFAFVSREDAERLSGLLAEAQWDMFSKFASIEGDVTTEIKSLP